VNEKTRPVKSIEELNFCFRDKGYPAYQKNEATYDAVKESVDFILAAKAGLPLDEQTVSYNDIWADYVSRKHLTKPIRANIQYLLLRLKLENPSIANRLAVHDPAMWRYENEVDSRSTSLADDEERALKRMLIERGVHASSLRGTTTVRNLKAAEPTANGREAWAEFVSSRPWAAEQYAELASMCRAHRTLVTVRNRAAADSGEDLKVKFKWACEVLDLPTAISSAEEFLSKAKKQRNIGVARTSPDSNRGDTSRVEEYQSIIEAYDFLASYVK